MQAVVTSFAQMQIIIRNDNESEISKIKLFESALFRGLQSTSEKAWRRLHQYMRKLQRKLPWGSNADTSEVRYFVPHKFWSTWSPHQSVASSCFLLTFRFGRSPSFVFILGFKYCSITSRCGGERGGWRGATLRLHSPKKQKRGSLRGSKRQVLQSLSQGFSKIYCTFLRSM